MGLVTDFSRLSRAALVREVYQSKDWGFALGAIAVLELVRVFMQRSPTRALDWPFMLDFVRRNLEKKH